MTGLIFYFFFVAFFVGFARFALELLIRPRNEFLFKLSIMVMSGSAVVLFLINYLNRLEERYGFSFFSQITSFLIFLAAITFCAWVGFLWLKRL